MKDLFFTPEIELDLDWRGFHFHIGSVRPQNKKQISESLLDLSPESIRNRFHGSKREFSEKELMYLTSTDGWNHYALGIVERDGLKRGVAVCRLVRSSHSPQEAEVAITIIDQYQRMGLGSLLIDCIKLAALERGILNLSFTFLPQNEAIKKLINKAGMPVPGIKNQDYTQLYLNLKNLNIEELKSRLSLCLPAIETFHLKT